ncbi:MAG: hypothetical protein QNK85_04060 [Crocinitomicaceae bacterium]
MLSLDLVAKTLKHYHAFISEKIVVSPSLPILYFGDLSRYGRSELKIVTVGKNPSNNEFKLSKNDSYSFVRFQKWRSREENLIETLNAYFKTIPLKNWFSSFEPILNGLDSSYYGGKKPNIAIHTDICSPLATWPTWSKLTDQEKSRLFKDGHQIWLQLIEELQPDIMLISIPHALFSSVVSSNGESLLTFNQKKDGSPRSKPYEVTVHNYVLRSGKTVKVVFGQAANKPFDTISTEQKHEIGQKTLTQLSNLQVL